MLTHVLPHESPKPDTKSGDLTIPGGICSHRGQKRLASRNQPRRYFQSSVPVQGLEGAPASDSLGLSVKGCCCRNALRTDVWFGYSISTTCVSVKVQAQRRVSNSSNGWAGGALRIASNCQTAGSGLPRGHTLARS